MGFVTNLKTNAAALKIVNKSKGESIQDVIDRDNQLSPEECATIGCSFPVK